MRVTINGRGFGVEKLGESGPRVVLIMGFGMSRIGWFPQVDDLKRDHQLLTFDNRGTGESDPVDEPYTLDDLADDTVALMDHVIGRMPISSGYQWAVWWHSISRYDIASALKV